MGRKKRKVAEVAVEAPPPVEKEEAPVPAAQPPKPVSPTTVKVTPPAPADAAPAASGYAMQSHGAEIIGEDLYVSEGSESEEEAEGEEQPEVVLANSRLGLMRRGLLHPSGLVQPNRQWQRDDVGDKKEGEASEEEKKVEEELAKLDPAQRAARLLVEKQRKLEEAKETARRLESEENAGRDPCLFSKRTSFDIRMDQIEDKPWTRGAGDLTDFFNYGFGEDDWLEYSQQQLMIRQELTDASRQRRQPDPGIVPVTPRTPNKQTPRVAVAGGGDGNENGDGSAAPGDVAADGTVIGPTKVKTTDGDAMDVEEDGKGEKKVDVEHVGVGGAWGAGAAPGSVLARLIEEQERKTETPSAPKEQYVREEQPSGYRGREDWGGSQSSSQRSDWNQDSRDSYYGSQSDQGSHYQDDRYHQQQYPRRGGFHQGNGPPPPPSYYDGRGRGGGPPPRPPYQQPPPPHWAGRGGRGGGGDYHSRKRYREDHDRWRR